MLSPTGILHAIDLPDEHATAALGARLAGLLEAGDAVMLAGGLGAGKTALARAVVRAAAGEPELEVPSPTYTLVQGYETACGMLWHFDLYRLNAPDAVLELGWDEARAGICLVEWPERLGPLLPSDRLDVALDFADEGRRAVVTGHGVRGAALARALAGAG